jgi:hypothetical protein
VINSGRVRLVLWPQTSSLSEMMQSCKCFPHVSKMSTLSYNMANSFIIKNDMTLNIIHYTVLYLNDLVYCLIFKW